MLKHRYVTELSAAKNDPENEIYRLRDHMTSADVRYNVDQMRKEAAELHRHADALESWWDAKQKAKAKATI